MNIARWYILTLVVVLGWLSVRPLMVDRSLGSAENPIKLMLTPSTDAQAITRNGEQLAEYLTAKTGLHVKVSVPNYYITVVEAFGTERADVAIMNTFSYLLANAKYGAHAVMRVVRRYGEQTYRGEIIVRVDAGIDSVAQLQGKTIAYVDPSSTSGYIYPKEVLRRQGIVPREEVFANGHTQAVLKVYQKDVDAGACFYSARDTVSGEYLDARAKIAPQHPDVYDVIKILALSDPIPNDPVVMRRGLSADVQDKLVQALMEFQSTPQGKAALMTIASIEGFVPTTDADYNDVRTLVGEYGISLENELKKSKR